MVRTILLHVSQSPCGIVLPRGSPVCFYVLSVHGIKACMTVRLHDVWLQWFAPLSPAPV
jgi:hypothetical protein